jgi:hypothetical protein
MRRTRQWILILGCISFMKQLFAGVDRAASWLGTGT